MIYRRHHKCTIALLYVAYIDSEYIAWISPAVRRAPTDGVRDARRAIPLTHARGLSRVAYRLGRTSEDRYL